MQGRMTDIKDEATTPHSITDALAPLKKRIADQLEKGIKASEDPTNAGLPELALCTTTIYSPWYSDTCPECKDKFRKDDRVRVCPRCDTAYHDDGPYQLDCWQSHFAGGNPCRKSRKDPITRTNQPGCGFRWNGRLPDAGNENHRKSATRLKDLSESFVNGVERHWVPFGGADVDIALKGGELVGRICPWCDFRIRPGDRVVSCPCGHCNTWFHDDIHRHLTCWDAWNANKGHDFCPESGQKLEKPGTGR